MGIVNKSIAEISQPEELLDFISENGIAITMTDKEAEMLLGYMEGHDYVIGFAGGDLYRGDLDEIPGEIVWDEYSVDDLIDSVCEWNYELILDMDAARQNPADMVDFSNKQSKYESLKQEEAVLDKLFASCFFHTVKRGDTSAHTNGGIYNAKRSNCTESVASDITNNCNFILGKCIEHTAVGTSRTHYGRSDGYFRID